MATFGEFQDSYKRNILMKLSLMIKATFGKEKLKTKSDLTVNIVTILSQSFDISPCPVHLLNLAIYTTT